MRSFLFAISLLRPVHALGLLACIGATAAQAQSLPTKALLGLESKQQRVRIVSLSTIRQSQDPRARRIIEGMLSDSAPAVRAAAAENLGELKDSKAIPALRKRGFINGA